jgi:hypothetical protein
MVAVYQTSALVAELPQALGLRPSLVAPIVVPARPVDGKATGTAPVIESFLGCAMAEPAAKPPDKIQNAVVPTPIHDLIFTSNSSQARTQG